MLPSSSVRIAALSGLLLVACGPKKSSDTSSSTDTSSPGTTDDTNDTEDTEDTDSDTEDSGEDTDSGDDRPALPDLDALEASLWAAYVADAPAEWSAPTASGSQVEQSLTRGASTMRYTVARQGSSTDPVPLFIGLHGGGGTAASVNDSQWVAMQSYYKDSVTDGIYVAPRGISNNWNLHFEADSYPLYDQLIERLIVQENVDPDRVYLLGFSAGGDGVYQVTPRLADRFAGANMSAGHPNGVPGDNLANVPFLLQVGEFDTAYDRHLQTALYAQHLDGLAGTYAGLYTHDAYIHKDGTHNSPWSDRDPSGRGYPVIADYNAWLASGSRSTVDTNSNAVYWLQDHTRNPWPTQVVWQLGVWADRDGREVSSYWLAVDETHRGTGYVVANYDASANRITLTATDVPALKVRLNHHMLDLGAPITVDVDGVETVVDVYPSEALMAETLALRGDPRHIYSAELEVTWTDGTATVTPLTVFEE